jgi:membrane-associated protein
MSLSFNLTNFLLAAGYLGLFAGVFAETGFLIGVILPGGETLVFTAALLASQGYLNIWAVALLTFIAAVTADSLEYAFGRKYGPRVFKKEGSRFFDKKCVDETRAFYERYGGKTLILARFLPFIRTFAPAFAGVGKMDYGRFAAYNIAGGALWAASVSALGYYLGQAMPNATHYLIAVALAIAVASAVVSWLMIRRQRTRN